MPKLANIQQRLQQACDSDIPKNIVSLLASKQYKGQLLASEVAQLCQQYKLNNIELALHCLPLAACYALVPVSNFYVGAVAIGVSGNFYFGANQEFAHSSIAQSVHAEQSAISHSWIAGEAGITDVVVNYTPCGHCRQFMNELNTASQLKIHLPHSQNNLLHSYLPDAFGPRNLEIKKVLFDPLSHPFALKGDDLTQAAIRAAKQAYAPYSKAVSGIALQAGEQILTGRYAENAAFNPSFPPLQCALNYQRLLGLADLAVSRIVLAEQKAVLSHRKMSEDLAAALFGLPVEYVELEI